jgi:hypothetical protein
VAEVQEVLILSVIGVAAPEAAQELEEELTQYLDQVVLHLVEAQRV